jgi:hypothetical protein
MKKNTRVYWTIAFYVVFAFIYLFFFLLKIENFSIFMIIAISSVSVLSSSTIYTIIQSNTNVTEINSTKDKYSLKKKINDNIPPELIEDYFEAMPLIDHYANSDESYEEISRIDEFIFTEFDKEELYKIDNLKLSKMDKIFFLREMLYFEASERKDLIDNMLKSQQESDEQIIYSPSLTPFGLEHKLRVYIRSLLEPGEKTKIIIIEKSDFIAELKDRIGILFDYLQEDFVLSSGGILLDEKSQVKQYDIDDDDEIAIIPSRKERK